MRNFFAPYSPTVTAESSVAVQRDRIVKQTQIKGAHTCVIVSSPNTSNSIGTLFLYWLQCFMPSITAVITRSDVSRGGFYPAGEESKSEMLAEQIKQHFIPRVRKHLKKSSGLQHCSVNRLCIFTFWIFSYVECDCQFRLVNEVTHTCCWGVVQTLEVSIFSFAHIPLADCPIGLKFHFPLLFWVPGSRVLPAVGVHCWGRYGSLGEFVGMWNDCWFWMLLDHLGWPCETELLLGKPPWSWEPTAGIESCLTGGLCCPVCDLEVKYKTNTKHVTNVFQDN